MKPIAFVIMGKEARTRFRVHDESPHEIAESLSSYGIGKDMIPTQIGGSLQLDPSKWLANRRAIEMEEIE